MHAGANKTTVKDMPCSLQVTNHLHRERGRLVLKNKIVSIRMTTLATTPVNTSMEKLSFASSSFPSPIFFATTALPPVAEHDADGEYDIDDRIDDIDCGQRIISKKARDKNAVRDCITGHEYHR